MLLSLKKIFCKEKKLRAGFSLVELIMVVAIFIIITGVILSKQSKFSSDILITNVAYDIALSIREAQVYGVGAKYDGASTTVYPYGVSFALATPKSFIFFVDNGPGIPNGQYIVSDDTLIQENKLAQGQNIKKLCVYETPSWSCGLNKLNISFIKPNPDPIFANENNPSSSTISEAVIIVESALGDKCRAIRVNKVGQISVDPIKVDVDTCGTSYVDIF